MWRAFVEWSPYIPLIGFLGLSVYVVAVVALFLFY